MRYSSALLVHPYNTLCVPLGSTSLWIIAHLIGLFTYSDLHYSIFDRTSTTPESPTKHHSKLLSTVRAATTVSGGIPEVISKLPH